MRSATRAYDVVNETYLPINPFFLYYGLSYDESTERWVETMLTDLGK